MSSRCASVAKSRNRLTIWSSLSMPDSGVSGRAAEGVGYGSGVAAVQVAEDRDLDPGGP